MSNWLINASKKWVIDPITNTWKIGNAGDGCCYINVVKCSDSTTTNFWMTVANAIGIGAFKYQGVCYRFGGATQCLPGNGTLLTPAQVQVFSSCSTCQPTPPCPWCDTVMARVIFSGVSGSCCALFANSAFDLPFLFGTTTFCQFQKSIGPAAGGTCGTGQVVIGISLANTASGQFDVNASTTSGISLSSGSSLNASNPTTFCNGGSVTVNMTTTSAGCGLTGTATIIKL